MGVSHLSMIIATILLLLLILEAQCDTSQGHKLHLNYVKPYKHTTCPGDPCLTLEEYRNAADDYFCQTVSLYSFLVIIFSMDD